MKIMKDEFYPTPKELLEEITKGIDWSRIKYILEPSAGKGDIADFCREKTGTQVHRGISYQTKPADIDCIEIDSELQACLKGKGFKVVHNDFLNFHTFKHYDLIIMNPPFSTGADHLLKAINLNQDDCGIICILNAETIKNPYSNTRKDLLRKLTAYNANIFFIDDAFTDAERETSVEIAVVKLVIPAKEKKSFIYDQLKSKEYYEGFSKNLNELAPNDYIEAAVRMYEAEVEAGIRLIRESEAIKTNILNHESILHLSFGKYVDEDFTVNNYVRLVRGKYWEALFKNEKFTGQMTSNLLTDYLKRIEDLKEYDFSYYNIKSIQIELSKSLIKGIEDCIIGLFDELSHQYAYWGETSNNIHYFNGWRTNKSWIINKKVILPLNAYDNTFKEYLGYQYKVESKLADIEKALNYLDGGLTDSIDLKDALSKAKETGTTKNIRLKYFDITFFKKGTCHIVFRNDDLLKKLNIFGAQHKGWLPPSYGKVKYTDLSNEEKQVVDAFEGEGSYNKTKAQSDYFLSSTSLNLLEKSA